MKTHQILAMMLGTMAIAGFASCTDDDDVSPQSIPQPVKTAFSKMFPRAQSVDWEIDLQYYVADFTQDTFDTEAWFTAQGVWAMTETDYGSLVSMLPAVVADSFNSSQYSDWIVDDAKYYQRTADSFSVIEVETDGFPEIALFYDTFGNLINKVQGDDYDINPTTVVSDLTY